MSTYIFDQGWSRERERHDAVQRLWDPWTTQHIEALGIREGWRCLEIGGGGGSVTRWMGERVGPTGSVLATDLDPRFLEQIELPNVEARRHDILKDELPAGAFDLVHSRLLVENVADPEGALRKMVAALKPGGWLLVEDYDFDTRFTHPADAAAEAVGRAHAEHLRRVGGDPQCGRKLFGYVRATGLADLAAEARSCMYPGASRDADGRRMSVEQRRKFFVESGLARDEEIARFLDLLNDPSYTFFSPLMVTVWGRKPA